jgi:cytochrome bd-type quinol oxidase subunit 1
MLTLSLPKFLFVGLLNDGGTFMYFILIAFLFSLFFIVNAFLKRKKDINQSKKMLGLAIDASLLALVIGCFGSVLGLIQLFDMVEAVGNVKPDLFASGLKVSLLTITFGLFAFVVGRICILIYKWTDKSIQSN